MENAHAQIAAQTETETTAQNTANTQMAQTFAGVPGWVVVQTGSKFFWRYRASLEFLIVEHKAFDVMELITYDGFLDRESPRVYIRPSAIESALDPEKVEEAFLGARELVLRKHSVPDNALLRKATLNNLRLAYIVGKLEIMEYSKDPKFLRVGLGINYRCVCVYICVYVYMCVYVCYCVLLSFNLLLLCHMPYSLLLCHMQRCGGCGEDSMREAS
jgi:hypothetical protein